MSRRRSYYEDENEGGVVQMLASYTKNPIVLGTMALVTCLALTTDASMVFGMFYSEKDTRIAGRLPHSLLTLDYPYTMLRGVVQEQPIEKADVPFFWNPHKPDALLVQKILTSCYGIELIELDSLDAIKKAKEVNLPSRQGDKFAISSPYIREVAEMFTPENLGRATCFFRHPLDYALDDQLPTYDEDDNWMARFLLNDGKSHLGFKQLGDAKQIVRDVCVSVTRDKLVPSIERAANYYGWELEGSKQCVEEAVGQANTEERHLDHESDEWKTFYAKNYYDCQLYEVAQQVWRAQIQTVIPLYLQLKRAKQYGGDEEEETDEDES